MAADTTYPSVVQIRQDGNMAVPTGKSIDVESGGIFKNAGTAVTSLFGLVSNSGTASATAGAATLSKTSGVITSEALTTAGLASYTLTLTNTLVAATSIVIASLQNGTNTQGTPSVGLVTPGSGSVVITVRNLHASQALNGTIIVSFAVINPA